MADDGAGIMAMTQTTYWSMSSWYCCYDLIISLSGKPIDYDNLLRPVPCDMACYQYEILVILMSSLDHCDDSYAGS